MVVGGGCSLGLLLLEDLDVCLGSFQLLCHTVDWPQIVVLGFEFPFLCWLQGGALVACLVRWGVIVLLPLRW